MYEENFKLFSEACSYSVELAELKVHKQEMYIFREQEYRKTIEELRNEIDRRSQKPMQEVRKKSEDQKQLQNIKLQLNKNDPTATLDDDETDRDGGNQNKEFPQPEANKVKEIREAFNDINEGIETLQRDAQTVLKK